MPLEHRSGEPLCNVVAETRFGQDRKLLSGLQTGNVPTFLRVRLRITFTPFAQRWKASLVARAALTAKIARVPIRSLVDVP